MDASIFSRWMPEEAIDFPKTIEHTFLQRLESPEAERAKVWQLCEEAKTHGFYGVCIRPEHVAYAHYLLEDSPVKVVTVIGFPLVKVAIEEELAESGVGNVPTHHKLDEIKDALSDGADELDVVMNVRQFKASLSAGRGAREVLEEMHFVLMASQGRPVKWIIETDLLSEFEIQQAVLLCRMSGVAFVKTCTGMVAGGRGATDGIIRLIRKSLDDHCKGMSSPPPAIKASGGIRHLKQAFEMIRAGATRIGTSNAMAMLQEGPENNSEESA